MFLYESCRCLKTARCLKTPKDWTALWLADLFEFLDGVLHALQSRSVHDSKSPLPYLQAGGEPICPSIHLFIWQAHHWDAAAHRHRRHHLRLRDDITTIIVLCCSDVFVLIIEQTLCNVCVSVRVREKPGGVVALQSAAPGGAMQVWVMDFLYLQNKVMTSSVSQNKLTGHTKKSVCACVTYWAHSTGVLYGCGPRLFGKGDKLRVRKRRRRRKTRSRSRSRNIGVKVRTSHPCRQRDRMKNLKSFLYKRFYWEQGLQTRCTNMCSDEVFSENMITPETSSIHVQGGVQHWGCCAKCHSFNKQAFRRFKSLWSHSVCWFYFCVWSPQVQKLLNLQMPWKGRRRGMFTHCDREGLHGKIWFNHERTFPVRPTTCSNLVKATGLIMGYQILIKEFDNPVIIIILHLLHAGDCSSLSHRDISDFKVWCNCDRLILNSDKTGKK